MTQQVLKNTIVSIDYEMLDADGGLIEKTDQSISYLHGGYDGIFPRVEEALQGRATGDKLTVELSADDAFGEYDEDLVRVEPRNLFPKNVTVGMQFEGAAEGTDHAIVYAVTDISDETIVVDGNHPQAGKSVRFVCTITGVRVATAEELRHGHVHGEGGHHH